MNWKIKQHARNVHEIILYGYEHTNLFISDIHFDSRGCDRNLLKKHLEEAKKKDCLIFIFGDWFDLMQGRYDPRRSSFGKGLRDEYKGNRDEYMNVVIDDSVKFLQPYAENIAMITLGNHETSIMKNLGINPIQSLVDRLKLINNKCKIQLGGYNGWIVKRFKDKQDSAVKSTIIKYRHGDRGNAQRSKGVLQVDIDAMKWPDADIIVKGDDHQKWYFPSVIRNRISLKSLKVEEDKQVHIRCGSYVNSIGDEFDGWVNEKGFPPSNLGGWWVKIQYVSSQKKKKKIVVTEAQ